MAGILGSSWPGPFVVPPCTQPASLRSRHKVPSFSGSHGRVDGPHNRILMTANLVRFPATESIRWLSGMGVSSHHKSPSIRDKLTLCLHTSPRRGEVEAEAQRRLRETVDPRGLTRDRPLTRRASDDARDLSPAGRGTLRIRRWRCSRRYGRSDP